MKKMVSLGFADEIVFEGKEKVVLSLVVKRLRFLCLKNKEKSKCVKLSTKHQGKYIAALHRTKAHLLRIKIEVYSVYTTV